MTLRPVETRWFEFVALHADAVAALECLARSGAVELEMRATPDACVVFPGLRQSLAEFEVLGARYASVWPAPATPDVVPEGSPATIIGNALACLAGWAAEARAPVETLETLRHERADLGRLAEFLATGVDSLPDLALLAGAGPVLASRLYRLDRDAEAPETPAGLIVTRHPGETALWLLVVGPAGTVAAFDARMISAKALRIDLPAWLRGDRITAGIALSEHIADLDTRLSVLTTRLDALARHHGIAEALGNLAVMRWIAAHATNLEGSGRLVRITGWTTDAGARAVENLVATRAVAGLLCFPPPPQGLDPPLVLDNPPFVRRFEIFARMLGMPGRAEVDPSLVVSVLAPLLFGYMFGDVGQGAILVLAGLTLSRRLPLLAILVPCGLVAIVFGFLFGSVFGLETIIPPLWLHPIAEPVTVLAVPLAAGAAILAAGLLLDALEANWRGELSVWLAADAGFLLAYLATVATPLAGASSLWLAAFGLVWFVAGRALVPAPSLAAAGAALGHLVEAFLQILVNTLSFARVGAFALAHAGLSLAVTGLADAAGHYGFWLVLALGNALILALEGLAVGIQTTRLILFEFFIRFLKADGRPFRPLPLPEIDTSKPETEPS
ncbi:MAG: hypothetical protein R3D02_01375 [Hyphomicrobiales bacterium]